MSNYNKVILMGRLTRDAEVRHSQSGTAVVKFGLAVNEWAGEGKTRTTFVNVTMFGKRGEALAKHVKKGQDVFLEGRLDFSQWEKDGQKQQALGVVAERFEFVGGPRDAAAPSDEAPF